MPRPQTSLAINYYHSNPTSPTFLETKMPVIDLQSTRELLKVPMQEKVRLIQKSVSPVSENSIALEKKIMSDSDSIVEMFGYSLIALAAVLFVFIAYAMVGSFFVGTTGNLLLDTIHQDNYYFMLIPLSVPTTCFLIYLNWISMKFFRHS